MKRDVGRILVSPVSRLLIVATGVGLGLLASPGPLFAKVVFSQSECRSGFWHVITYDVTDPYHHIEVGDQKTKEPCDRGVCWIDAATGKAAPAAPPGWSRADGPPNRDRNRVEYHGHTFVRVPCPPPNRTAPVRRLPSHVKSEPVRPLHPRPARATTAKWRLGHIQPTPRPPPGDHLQKCANGGYDIVAPDGHIKMHCPPQGPRFSLR
jgi:hypothetical protein